SKLFPEFPAETSSLRRRVEQVPDLKGGQWHRITVVTAVNVQCGQRTERAAQPQLWRCRQQEIAGDYRCDSLVHQLGSIKRMDCQHFVA
ncbi:hypothetical protein ATANTOWER_029038, partial [Ataeniobius toweri]|nr:hypothetical protein [Ataeniobius toweri]